MERKIAVEIRFSLRSLRNGLAVLLLLVVAAELASETFTLTTYYPSPLGIYRKIVTTGDTILGRDSGKVGVGTAAPKAKLDVAGGIRLGNDDDCNGEKGGTLRYNAATKQQEFCDGQIWKTSAAGPVPTGLHGWCELSNFGECGAWAPAACGPSYAPGCGCPAGYMRIAFGVFPPEECNFNCAVAKSYGGQITRYTCLKL